MPTFLDRPHVVEGLSAAEVAAAHKTDLETQNAYDVNYKRYWVNKEGTKIFCQERYGVPYRHYWVDDKAGKVFCLVDAPSAQAAADVQRKAHGLVADEIFEVGEG